MFHSRVHIQAGDLVILYMNRDNMIAINVTPGEVFHNKFGRYQHDEMIGQKFGSKIHAPPPNSGYIHLLKPTPELWTLSLPHRTQILYLPDIAYITQQLGIRVGGKVAEAGTGSGSMTHSLSRSLGRRGRLLSYEYHRGRYEKASAEFEGHGLSNVTLEHRNVCKDGFGEVSGVEAVFLDLPAPWEAIPYTVKILRPDIITKICCFSPCLEQVLKTVSTLRTEGFSDIFTQEVLSRTHELVPAPAANSSHLSTVSSLIDRLKDHERRKEQRRVVQMRTARTKSKEMKEKAFAPEAALAIQVDEEGNDGEAAGTKRKIDQVEEEPLVGAVKRAKSDVQPVTEAAPVQEAFTGIETSTGSTSTVTPPTNVSFSHSIDDTKVATVPTPSTDPTPREPFFPIWSEPSTSYSTAILTKPSPEMRGHTSYLTFASFYPERIRSQLAAQETKTLGVGSRRGTPVVGRVAKLAGGEGDGALRSSDRDGSVVTETDYGSEGLEAVIGTLSEEEMIALAGGS